MLLNDFIDFMREIRTADYTNEIEMEFLHHMVLEILKRHIAEIKIAKLRYFGSSIGSDINTYDELVFFFKGFFENLLDEKI